MLDMFNLSAKALYKYNLEKVENVPGFNPEEFFIKLISSEWWVLGIDEEKNLLYVEYDGDDIFHGIDTCAIDALEDNDYVLVGRCTKYIPGLVSTRDSENPIDDVKDFINGDRVYRIKYVGPDVAL